jgi:hypothetical protein
VAAHGVIIPADLEAENVTAADLERLGCDSANVAVAPPAM